MIDENRFFFLIDSENVRSFDTGIYGYSVSEKGVFDGNNINEIQSGDLGDCGCYVYIAREENGLRISQDGLGNNSIYVYQSEGYYALSNSFYKLVEHLKDKVLLHLNREYAEHFMALRIVGLSFKNTLIREIHIVPPNAELTVGYQGEISYSFKQNKYYFIEPGSTDSLDILDKWHDKWVSIIRGIADNTDQIVVDLSGGIDSRLTFMLILESDVDLDKIVFRSATDQLATHKEDYLIASALSERLGFKLNDSGYFDEAKDYIGFDEAFNLYINTKLGFHKELWFPTYRYKSKRFHFGGFGGEILRPYWDMDIDELLESKCAEADRFPSEVSDDLRNSVNTVLNQTLQDIENHYSGINDMAATIFRETYSRNHFGKTMIERFYSNEYVIAPLMDPILQKIKHTTEEYEDKNLLIALMFTRYAEYLLDVEFQGGRRLSQQTIEMAKRFNSRCPYKKNNDIQGDKQFAICNTGDEYITDNTTEMRMKDAEDYILDKYRSEYFFRVFSSCFHVEIYEEALKSLKTLNWYPIRHVISVYAVTEILMCVMESQRSKYDQTADNEDYYRYCIDEIRKSKSFKIGRAITWLPRLIRGW